jgi:hypothetical protein
MASWFSTSRPRFLYKYVSCARWDVVRNREIRFTQFDDLNDPYETQRIRNITEVQSYEEYDRLIHPPVYTPYNPMIGWTPEKLQALAIDRRRSELEREEYIKQALLSLGILSLSAQPDNLLLWAHYAENHRGMILQFDTESRFFSEQYTPHSWFRQHNRLFQLHKVRYVRGIPVLRSVRPETSLEKIIFTKSAHWRYEDEWRLCRPLAEANRVIESAPFPICLFSFPSSALRAVYFGSRIARDAIDEYISTVQTEQGEVETEFYSAVLGRDRFVVSFRRISN